MSGCDNVAEFQKLTPINRDKAILKLRDQHLSLRQISRLTGVSLTTVRRIVEE
ncbi:MAG: helix-turn-helix domain-containing protein [Oscillospiraceae bacterium]|nr:helix-turn-helix domain-containing protein [Oscillospiraceae bacterium]